MYDVIELAPWPIMSNCEINAATFNGSKGNSISTENCAPNSKSF